MDQLIPLQTRHFPKPKSNPSQPTPDSAAQQQHQQQNPPTTTTSTPTKGTPVLTPESALTILTSQPQEDELLPVLRWLLNQPSPSTNAHANKSTTQLIHTLSNTIIPHHWPTANQSLRHLLVRNLRSVAGVGALVARLRSSLSLGPDPHSSLPRGAGGGSNVKVNLTGVPGRRRNEERARALAEVLIVLEAVLAGEEGVLEGLWRGSGMGEGEGTRGMLQWKEAVGLVAGGRVLSVAGEAEGVVWEVQGGKRERSWVAEGERYVR